MHHIDPILQDSTIDFKQADQPGSAAPLACNCSNGETASRTVAYRALFCRCCAFLCDLKEVTFRLQGGNSLNSRCLLLCRYDDLVVLLGCLGIPPPLRLVVASTNEAEDQDNAIIAVRHQPSIGAFAFTLYFGDLALQTTQVRLTDKLTSQGLQLH